MQTHSAEWSYSSAGSEHLPYKQGVQGSNPCGTTISKRITPFKSNGRCFFMPSKKFPNLFPNFSFCQLFEGFVIISLFYTQLIAYQLLTIYFTFLLHFLTFGKLNQYLYAEYRNDYTTISLQRELVKR